MEININNKWTQNSQYIMKYAMNQSKKGNIFPIWGTCQGMQQLAYLTSGYDLKAVAPVRGEVAVRNTIQIQPDNTLFKDLPQDLLNSLESGVGVLYFNHHFAVTRDYFNNNVLLQQFWDVEAFTTTSFSEQFLSVFKAK